MPAMPRPSNKTKAIAEKILGVPANMRKNKKTYRKKQTDKRLVFEETSQVR